LFLHTFSSVPYFRERYRQAGLTESDICGVEDLWKLPIIDKTDLRAVAAEQRIAASARGSQDLIEICTSGSTGQPFSFWIDSQYDQYRKAQSLRAQLAAGRRLTDRVLRLSDVNPDLRGRARPQNDSWFRRLGILNEHHLFPDADVELQIREIARLRPAVIHAYGSTLVLIVTHARENNLRLHTPRLILTDSELLLAQQRREIELGFRAPVRDIYGSFETDNIAYECPEGGSYHITTDSVVLEILCNDIAATAGRPGDVVCTVLHNLTSPFIRYRLGDVAVLADRDCACRTSFPTLRMLAGRSDDYAVDTAGRRISPRSFLARFDTLAAVREYQIHQASRDRFIVTVVPVNGALSDQTRDMITANIREAFPSAHVSIDTVDRLARGSSGKLRAFTSAVVS
jgi:phenylacetate-CoA ligase